MSTNPQSTGRKMVVVNPSMGGAAGPVSLGRGLVAGAASAVVHVGLLFMFLMVTVAPPAVGAADVEVIDTQVEDQPKEPDLTNPDVGNDTDLQTNFDVDRIDPDKSVPGQVDPTANVGIVNAPEDAVRATLPAPPGTGQGTGLAPLTDVPGLGSTLGTPGGMNGPLFKPGSFGGRSGATRTRMVAEGGGNALSEAAVARGLEWLAFHQANDGHWGLHDFNRHARDKPFPAGKTFTCNCTGLTTRQNDIAATAFGLLPFLGAGQTNKPNTEKTQQRDYHKSVDAGLKYLMNKQGKDGYYGGDMYAHGLATIAMCEAYGLTNDPMLKGSAQRAINFIVSAQDSAGGGWRYTPRTAGDTSVTGWELMALKSGQMASLSVPSQTLKLVERYLDSVESTAKGGYSYVPGSGETVTMTAVGLLCRQYLGVNPRNPGLLAGVERLKKAPPGTTNNLYYEYYATQVMHHMGGESWQFWNGTDGKSGIRDTLIRKQDAGADPKRVHQGGSWEPAVGGGVNDGGRMMSTALSVLCLEVYYRHLPLYRRDMGVTK